MVINLVVSDGIVEFTSGGNESQLLVFLQVVVGIVVVMDPVSVMILIRIGVMVKVFVILSINMMRLREILIVMPVFGMTNGLMMIKLIVIITVYLDDWLVNGFVGAFGILIIILVIRSAVLIVVSIVGLVEMVTILQVLFVVRIIIVMRLFVILRDMPVFVVMNGLMARNTEG